MPNAAEPQAKIIAKSRHVGLLDVSVNPSKQTIMFVCMICAALCHCVSIGIAAIFFVAVAIITFVFSDLDDCLVSLFVCLPFFNVMTVSIGETSFYYILIAIFTIKIILSKQISLSRGKLSFLFVALLVTIGNIQDPSRYVRWLLVFLPLVLTFRTPVLHRNLYRVVVWYSAASLVSACFGYYLSDHGLMALTNSYVYSESGNLNRFGGLVGDPVMFAETLVFLLACNITYLLKGKGTKASILLTIGLVIPCALSYSKSAIIMIAVLVVIAVIYLLTHQMLAKETILKGILALCLIVLLIIATFIFVNSNQSSDLIAGILRRFDANDLTTGRTSLWASYWAWISEQGPVRWILGVGFSDYNSTLFSSAGILLNRCHNIYLETWVLFGGVEAVALAILFVYMIGKAVISRVELVYFLPMLVLLAFGFVLHGHTESFYYFLWIIALGMICTTRGEADEQEEGR